MDKDKILEPVSIVITVYNRSELLRETIDSALRQTYPNIEVLIIDDGSTDDTAKICTSYGDRIRYIYKENGGHASALNRGVSEMRGTWFKWLDSDDVLEENAVEELVKCANEKNARIVYSDYSVIDIHGSNTGVVTSENYTSYLDFAAKLWNNAFNSIVNPNCILVHKSVFEEVGFFDTSIKYPNDIHFFMHACIIHGIMFHKCPKLLLRYRVHKKQWSSAGSMENVKEVIRVRDMIRQKYIERNGQEAWNELMKEFRKRNRGLVWKPMAAKLVTVLPQRAGVFVFRLYKSALRTSSILHKYE
ncbi:MAG: glycosyltransferase involved in cell wall biosynthesis [Candidatus Nitrosomirales archaeon]|jgi:glycosyltransferase involved in cell wall biosynthesis